ncbi:hypothetical protein ACLBW7_09945 [Klebsiella grimontii]|uniref:hypothetical protein n=1 Tax=Klebsiella pasteurii TaxID=2587529 RepID=UPI00115A5D96|nr:hypothetical protein [Klebsiella pasteurii]
MSITEGNLAPVPVMSNEIDFSADVVSMTPYQTSSGDVVNFAFMGPKVSHFLDASGQVSQAKIDIVKLGSVTMTKSAVQEFHDALTTLINERGWKK